MQVRRLVSDGGSDILRLDGTRVVASVNSKSALTVAIPEPAIDAMWCPLKQGCLNSAFVVACSVGPVMMFDGQGGEVRGSFVAKDSNDKVLHAQSVMWLRSNPACVVGGYGMQEAPILCGFDINSSTPCWTLSLEKVPPPTFCGSTKPGLVTAMEELQSVVCFGNTLGEIMCFDTRSKCISNVFGRAQPGGRAHIRGICAVKSLEDSNLLISVPRAGDSSILLWDIRNPLSPVATANRGDYNRHQYGGPVLGRNGVVVPCETGLMTLQVQVGGFVTSHVDPSRFNGAKHIAGNTNVVSELSTFGPLCLWDGGKQLMFTVTSQTRELPKAERNVLPLCQAESDEDASLPTRKAWVVEFSDSDYDEDVHTGDPSGLWSLPLSAFVD